MAGTLVTNKLLLKSTKWQKHPPLFMQESINLCPITFGVTTVYYYREHNLLTCGAGAGAGGGGGGWDL